MYIVPKGLIHELPNGTKYHYDERMQIVSESYPDGTKCLYYPNGNLHIEFLPCGILRLYRKNGKLAFEIKGDDKNGSRSRNS